MSKFYFDFHDDNGTTIDVDGEEFANVEAAKREAWAALGDAGREYARRYAEGRLAIVVRDGRSLILEVSATFEARSIKT